MPNDAKLKVILEAKDLSARGFKSFQNTIKKVTGNIFSMQGALVGLVGGTGFGALIKSSFDLNDNLAKTADRLGLTTEALGGLRHAGELTGVSTQTLDMAIQRMTRRISEAAQGTGVARDALDELGLSAQDLARKSPDEALRAVADAMGNVQNQSDQVRLAFKLFDSEGVKILNTLKLGSKGLNEAAQEAQDFGLAISRVDAKAIEDANDSFTRAQAAVKGVATIFAVELAPHLEKAATDFSDFVKDNRELVGLKVENTIAGISDGIKDIVAVYNKLPDEVIGAAGAGILGRILLGSWSPAKWLALASAMKSTAEAMGNEILKAGGMEGDKSIIDMLKALGGQEDQTGKFFKVPPLPGGKKTPAPALTSPPDKSYFDWISPDDEAIYGIEALSDSWKEFDDRVKKIMESQKDYSTEYIDSWRFAEERAEESAAAMTRAIEMETGSSFDYMRDAFMGWGNQFSSMLNDVLWDADTTFKDIAESFARMLTQMAIQKKIVEPIFGAIFPNAQGNVYDRGELVPFGSGGIIPGPTILPLAGEAGPEAILPLTRTAGGDLGVKAQSSGVTINVINNAGVQVSTQEQQTPQGPQIDVIIEELVANKMMQQGTAMNRVMRKGFGANTPIVRR